MTPEEQQLLELLRKAEPYDKIEINISQDGTWTIIHRKQKKVVIKTQKLVIEKRKMV